MSKVYYSKKEKTSYVLIKGTEDAPEILIAVPDHKPGKLFFKVDTLPPDFRASFVGADNDGATPLETRNVVKIFASLLEVCGLVITENGLA